MATISDKQGSSPFHFGGELSTSLQERGDGGTLAVALHSVLDNGAQTMMKSVISYEADTAPPQSDSYAKKTSINSLSPIALDLDGSGAIEVTGETTSFVKDADAVLGDTVEFDLDADGTIDTIEWFSGGGDGILVNMAAIDDDGSIDGSALFGDEGGTYTNGFEKLEIFDTDGDSVVAGEELDSLGLWLDDGDAVLEDGELVSAADADILSISTTMTVELDDEGRPLMQSTATTSDGGTVLTEDVWFGGAPGDENRDDNTQVPDDVPAELLANLMLDENPAAMVDAENMIADMMAENGAMNDNEMEPMDECL